MTSDATLHRRALDQATDVVHGMGDAARTRPSRCAGWTVADLLEHMVGQNVGFAEAIATGDAPASAYRPRSADDWDESARELVAAVEKPAAAVRLAEVRPDAPLPLDAVLRIHALDLAVHTWDLVGDPYRPSDEVVALVLAVAERLPERAEANGTFDATLEATTDDPWRRALRLLGRDT